MAASQMSSRNSDGSLAKQLKAAMVSCSFEISHLKWNQSCEDFTGSCLQMEWVMVVPIIYEFLVAIGCVFRENVNLTHCEQAEGRPEEPSRVRWSSVVP